MRVQPIDCLAHIDDVDGAVKPEQVVLAQITVHQMTRPVHRLHVLENAARHALLLIGLR